MGPVPPVPQSVPTAVPGMGPSVPAGVPEVPPVVEQAATDISGLYQSVGTITAEQLINGDPNQFRHLDGRIMEVVGRVQSDLVDAKMADELPKARFDKELRAKLANEIDRLALKHLMTMRTRGGSENPMIITSVVNEIIGLGPLEPLWADVAISEVIVNGPEEVFVERAGKLLRANGVRFRSPEHLLDMCQRILAPLNRKLDVKDPLADGRLPDGSRVNAVHTAIAPHGPLITIRRFPEANRNIADLVGLGAMTEEMACTLMWLVKSRATVLVCGGTGTGKTTLLNALSAAIPRYERVVTIEDSLELRLHPASHVAAMEARPADASGSNAVPIRLLVKNALRMRPDRIIVGEIRDQAALDMLQACNTGHEGSMSTVHANGPNEAVSRLAVMVAQGGEIPADKVDWLVGSALDLIVMIRRYKDGSRRVSGIYEVPEATEESHLRTIPLWEWERTGEDADGRIQGHYVQQNAISQELREKLGLDFEPMVTWEEVQAMTAR